MKTTRKTRKMNQQKFDALVNQVLENLDKVSEATGDEKVRLYMGLFADVKNLHEIITKAKKVWLFNSKRKKAKKVYEELKTKVIEAAQQYKSSYDETLKGISEQLKKIGRPRYILDDKLDQAKFDENFRLFNEYVDQMVSTFGDWMLDLKLRHDPWDTDSYGSISIREVRANNCTNRAWYPWDGELKKRNMCYGALLLEAAMMQRSFSEIIMHHNHGQELPDYHCILSHDGYYYDKSHFEERLQELMNQQAA